MEDNQQASKSQELPDLVPGMTVEVLTLDNKLTFVGKVERFSGDTITIRDAKKQALPPVMFNKEIKLRFFQGADTLVIHGKICGSSRKIWKLDHLKNMFAAEKRTAFRQRVNLPAKVTCLRRSPDPVSCEVLDVSVGGLLLRSRELYVIGERLSVGDVRIAKEEDPFSFRCVVQRAGEKERAGRLYGCRFESLPPKEEDRLLRAIFIAQRQMLQNRQAYSEE